MFSLCRSMQIAGSLKTNNKKTRKMKNRDYTKDKNGLEKMRELIDTPKTVMLITGLDKKPLSVCPMTLQQMDEQGELWFFTSKQSDHFNDIDFNNKVQIVYADDDQNRYISIYGNATHIEDNTKRDELWKPELSHWFKDGKDDENLALMCINMEDAYYWDGQDQKRVYVLAMAEDSMDYVHETEGEKGYVNLHNH